jgi:hypothetical protein
VNLPSETTAQATYTWLVIDPATTAGAGVAAVNGFSVTSTRSGVGTWHLFAVDDADGSAGIRSYLVKLNNAVVSNNRSPVTGWDTVAQDGPFTAGFNAPRTALNAGQDPGNQTQVSGYGISANNFVASLPTADPTAFASTTSGQWGIYAVADGQTSGTLADGHIRNAIFLAEGTYAAGSTPSIDGTTLIGNGGTAFNFWKAGFPNNGSEPVSAAGSTSGQTLVIINQFPIFPEPATLTLVGLAALGFSGLVGRRRS